MFGEEAAANGVRDGAIVIVSCLRKPGDPRTDELMDLNPVASMVQAQGVSSALIKAAQGTGDDFRLPKVNGKRKLDLPEANGFHGKKIKENKEVKGQLQCPAGTVALKNAILSIFYFICATCF